MDVPRVNVVALLLVCYIDTATKQFLVPNYQLKAVSKVVC